MLDDQGRKLHAARQLRSAGYRLTVLDGKRPVLKGWADKPLEDRELCYYLRREARLNIGVLLAGGLAVVDVDRKTDEALRWAEDNGVSSPMACLTSRERHYYMRLPEGAEPRGRKIEGIGDLKMSGCVVAPPSEHPDGTVYRWEGGLLRPEQLPHLPAHLLRVEAARSDAHARFAAALPPGETIESARRALWRRRSVAGQGGDTELFKAACLLVQFYRLDDEAAYSLLAEWNSGGGCLPPWPESRLHYKLGEARRLM